MARRTQRVPMGRTNLQPPPGPSPAQSLTQFASREFVPGALVEPASQVSQLDLDGTTATMQHPARVSAATMHLSSPRHLARLKAAEAATVTPPPPPPLLIVCVP
jgi:hypothetical protein